jgi:hypothetical protein
MDATPVLPFPALANSTSGKGGVSVVTRDHDDIDVPGLVVIHL